MSEPNNLFRANDKRHYIREQELARMKINARTSVDVMSMYDNAAREDYLSLMSRVHSWSRFDNSTIRPKHKLNYVIDGSLEFDAFAFFVDKFSVELVLSFGAFLALDDLTVRLVCNKDFYSFDPQKDGERQWHGCYCHWLKLVGGILPYRRYLDYSMSRVKGAALGINSTFLSGFFEAIPTEQSRLDIANFMLHVAITWIMVHEEAHYNLGHLLYIQNAMGLRTTKAKLDETNGFEDFLIPAEINKVIEWQADRHATRAVIDVFFSEPCLAILPKYANSNQLVWLLRLIFTSIGLVTLIMQKSRSLNNSASNYPSPRTRLFAAYFIGLGRAIEHRGLTIDKFDLETINASILGSLDDLVTVADLINRDGKLESWRLNAYPQFEKTHNLGLIDTPDEALVVTRMILQSLLPNYPSNEPIQRKIYSKWFSELQEIINLHDNDLWNEFQVYRKQTGYPDG